MSDRGGFAIVMGVCCNCGRRIGFNPHRVPSILLDGQREPLCQVCAELLNKLLQARGLPTRPIMPGAYDPIPEEEL